MTQYLANRRVKCARLRGVPSQGFLVAAEFGETFGRGVQSSLYGHRGSLGFVATSASGAWR